MYEPYEVETISEGRLTARILQDTDPLSPFEDYEPPCAVVVTGNERDYRHLSTASLDDYAPDSVYRFSRVWYRETPAGNEVEIGDDDDMIAYLETRAGVVAEHVSFWGSSQSEWWDAVLIMDRDTIRREVSQYNRKNRPAPYHRVSQDRGIEHYDHAAQEWKAGDDPRPLPPTVTSSDREKAREMIRGYAATIRQYMQGDVYMVTVEDDEGEHVDALGSIYGIDYAREEARAMLATARETYPEYQYPSLQAWEDPEFQREEDASAA